MEIFEAVYGGAEGVAGLIEVSHTAEAAGGQIIPTSGPEGAEGVLMPFGGYYYEADRGAISEYDNQWNNAGWEGGLTYHPADNPQRLDKPLAVVHSESAAIPRGVKTFLTSFAGGAAQAEEAAISMVITDIAAGTTGLGCAMLSHAP